MADNNLINKSQIVKNYIRPTKIVFKTDKISNEEVIFTNDFDQIFLTDFNCLTCEGQGHIILDFGQETCGGIRILSSYKPGQDAPYNIRVRFGESLSETCVDIGNHNATNNHALRDIETVLPILSDVEIGNTGFRFVRIDFTNPEAFYCVKTIVGVSYLNNLPILGTFKSNDETLNNIFNTCTRTIQLCMQNMLWDGIKRDRLVWIGDMQPEALAATYIYGANDILERSITASRLHYPLPIWFGSIPSYNAWFMQIVADYYLNTGKKDFVLENLEYINGNISLFDKSIDENGHIDYTKVASTWEQYFIDWPSLESKSLENANRCLLIYVFNNILNSLSSFNINSSLVKDMIRRLENGVEKSPIKEKQLLSFQTLIKQVNTKEAFELLAKNGAHGFSTFMSYYIAKAISLVDSKKALDLIKEYYGGMLKLGATSFFEDFDIDWLNNAARIDEFATDGKIDVHASYGKYCYVGYRHSLCHGWSSGPIQFIIEEIVGLKVLEPGFKKICIKPRLSGLEWFDASIPSPYGVIKISYHNSDLKIDCPKEIAIEK